MSSVNGFTDDRRTTAMDRDTPGHDPDEPSGNPQGEPDDEPGTPIGVRASALWRLLRWKLITIGVPASLAKTTADAMVAALDDTTINEIEQIYSENRTLYGALNGADESGVVSSVFQPGQSEGQRAITALMRMHDLGILRYRRRFDTRRADHIKDLRRTLGRGAVLPDEPTLAHLVEIEGPAEVFPVLIPEPWVAPFTFGYTACRSSRAAARFLPQNFMLPRGYNK
jgi:hypothetical protein